MDTSPCCRRPVNGRVFHTDATTDTQPAQLRLAEGGASPLPLPLPTNKQTSSICTSKAQERRNRNLKRKTHNKLVQYIPWIGNEETQFDKMWVRVNTSSQPFGVCRKSRSRQSNTTEAIPLSHQPHSERTRRKRVRVGEKEARQMCQHTLALSRKVVVCMSEASQSHPSMLTLCPYAPITQGGCLHVRSNVCKATIRCI